MSAHASSRVQVLVVQAPALAAVVELHLEDIPEVLLQVGLAHRRDDLDALVEVALHQVGAADEVLGVTVVPEVVDASVLQEAPDHAHHPDAVAQPRDAGPQGGTAPARSGSTSTPACDAS